MTGTLIDSVEGAFRLLIKTAIGDAANVYRGKDSGNKKLPLVDCAADGDTVEEDPKTSGNYWVNVEITTKHTAATEASDQVAPNDDDTAFLKLVFDIIRVNNLDAMINAQGFDLTVFPTGIIFGSPKSGRDEHGVYTNTQPIRLYCCPSVIPA